VSEGPPGKFTKHAGVSCILARGTRVMRLTLKAIDDELGGSVMTYTLKRGTWARVET